MKKSYYKIFVVLLALFIATPKANAIITDPDDYLIYDSGILADSATAMDYVFPDFIKGTADVATKYVNVWGRGNNDPVSYGYPANTDIATVKQILKMWGLVIPQNNNASATRPVAGKISADNWVNTPDSIKKGYTWYYSSTDVAYYRPTDSIIIRIPKTCDSVFIQTCGTNSFYGAMVYELSEGMNNGWYNGGNWGAVYNFAFKPKHSGPGDSTDLVVLAPHKNWYNTGAAYPSGSEVNGIFLNVGAKNTDDTPMYFKGERWGIFAGTSINRIKLYGKIEKGSVPEFDGTVAGWTFSYTPKASGTIDETKPLSKDDGVEEIYYSAYASDLGVIRSKLTPTISTEGFYIGYADDLDAYVARMSGLGSVAAGDYTNGETHENYFQMDFSPVGYQDLVLNFDYAIREGSDSLVVAYLLDGASAWVVADELPNAEDPWSGMAHASIDMSVLDNVSGAKVRIMMSNNDNGNSELNIANLKLEGYDDYYVSNDDAIKVAYINNATDRIHTLDRATGSSDTLDTKVLLPLLEDAAYNVSVFTQKEWADITAENIEERFADIDVVIMAGSVPASSSIALAAKTLVGKKPFLNLNAGVYTSWDWATSATGDEDSAVVFTNNYTYHPLYSGISSTSYITANICDTITGESQSGLEGFTTAGYKGPDGYLMGSPSNSASLTCVHEINANPAAKYIMLGFTFDNINRLSGTGYKLITNAISYLNRASYFVAPTFNMVSDGAVVENTDELKAALAYDYSARGLTKVVIKMKPSTDEGGTYTLNEPMSFNNLGDLVFQREADSAAVTVKGSFAAKTPMYLTSVTFNNIIFEGSTATDGLFCIQANDTITGTFLVSNCTFNDIAGQSLLQAKSADNAQVSALVMQNNLFENFGGAAAEGKDFISMGNGSYELDSIIIDQNTFNNYHGASFINSERTASTAADSSLNYKITNNAFYKYSGTAAAKGNFLNMPNALKVRAIISIDNNLFYDSYGAQNAYSNINLYKDAMKGSFLSAQGNFFEPATAATEIVSAFDSMAINNLTKESLGLTTVFLDETLKTISKGSALYSAGRDYACVGLKANYVDRTEPGIVVVSNTPELKVALETAIGGDVIELENCNDAIDVYLLGNTGFVYPTTGGTLTIKAAEGHSPKLFGRISPNNAAVLDTLTYTGLHFVDSLTFTGYSSDSYSAFMLLSVISINEIIVENCHFSDQQNQYLLRTNNSANGMYVGKMIFRNNYLDNFGGANPDDGKSIGAHFMQYSNSMVAAMDSLIFVDNIVTNFHGSQFFNITREHTTNPDSSIYINISNNLFYRIGGCASSDRGFLEFAKTPIGCDVDIQINNNIFYERWSYLGSPIVNLQLYNDTNSFATSKVDVLNNFFEGEYYTTDETYGANPVGNSLGVNLPVSVGDVKPNYSEPLTRSSLNMTSVFVSTSPFMIAKTSPLFTAGTNGTHVGPMSVYDAAESIKGVSEKAMSQIYTNNGVLYIQSEQAASVEIFNTIGKLVYKGQVREGINTIEGMNAGSLYLLKIGTSVTKVIM